MLLGAIVPLSVDKQIVSKKISSILCELLLIILDPNSKSLKLGT